MRKVINQQLELDQIDISQIKINLQSRDDIPKILAGLQFVYTHLPLRNMIFKILETELSKGVSKSNGRPGLDLWKILVLGVIRLDLNCDYDRLQELANNHKVIRQMLGHGDFLDNREYPLQTLKDNISLLTPEILDKINVIIVEAGHQLIQRKADTRLHGRCDSFVVETNVHYPTDSNLLYDAVRKAIQLCAYLCDRNNMSDFRQSAYNIQQLKKMMRQAIQTHRSKHAKDTRKVFKAYQKYLNRCIFFINKISDISNILRQSSTSNAFILKQIDGFINHAKRQIDQINRRVLQDEIIPHHEKVFSIFEPHTEWISKGKAGVPVELGLRTCIMEDQYQFILHHQVMEKETDDAIAIPMVDATQKKFAQLRSVSFDKGFHSKNNQEQLKQKLDLLALPRKGRLSEAARIHEQSNEFRQARKQHSAVESAINALEVHGLDICRDRGIKGFKRYVALAVLAHNIHRIGNILHIKKQKQILKQKKLACSASNKKL